MQRILITLLFSLTGLSAWAQEPADDEQDIDEVTVEEPQDEEDNGDGFPGLELL